MSTTCKFDKLNVFPTYILLSLKRDLEQKKNYEQLISQLENTGITLEKDNFQLSLHSVKDLLDIKNYLDSKI
jgi:hypothetical protein